MKKKLLNRVCAGLVAFLLMGSLCACSEEEDRGKVIFTTGFGKDELFRIGEVSCTMPEYMLYLTNTQNRYEGVFGEEIWGLIFEDTTFEENVKDNVLAKIAQMKSVYLLAQEKGITLTEEEEQKLSKAAMTYYSSLSEAEIAAMGVTQETVKQLYTEYTLADKVYKQIISEVNPEISDDEARTITVEQIVLKTYATDSQGNTIVYSDKMLAETAEKIGEIRELATDGEHGFTELAGKYNEEENIRISFKKGEMDTAIEEAAFNLQTDEISQVIQTGQGYYLLKCISTFDREQTDANKLVLIEERKNEAFGKEYEDFVNKLARKLNDDLWQEVELLQTEDVTTDSFFEVYEKYFPAD
ncbi:MAG: peptidylprolyl isomerase [Lachnospiraceae bacterium]|nr:peptidylprolyl isomerase [Lachnospiraceae bacterium]